MQRDGAQREPQEVPQAVVEPHEQQKPAEDEVTEPPRRRDLMVIGVGIRGISAMKKLSGSSSAQDAELWAVDSDKKAFAGCASTVQVIDVQPSDDTVLSSEDLQRLGGYLPSELQERAASRPNHGAAFVLGSAFGSPGGASLMLQLVNYLRRCGYFVGVGLTRPFSFEGARKLEQADALIEAMEDVASMVVVVDQNVLTRASSELTMHEASAIADNTLEYTVRSLLSALKTPEVLKVTRGIFLWHGRDLRLMKRQLFPPMMAMATCPGVGNLGRGQAAIPYSALQQAGLPSALSTLAEDAVKAATDSPFLEGKVPCCTAALCVLLLPPSLMDSKALAAHVANLNDHHREYALRSAIQVAAMTVQEMAGPQCTDIIVCPQVREASDPAAQDPDVLTIECALLALQAIDDSAASSSKGQTAARGQGLPASPASSASSPSSGAQGAAAAAAAAATAPVNPLSRLDMSWKKGPGATRIKAPPPPALMTSAASSSVAGPSTASTSGSSTTTAAGSLGSGSVMTTTSSSLDNGSGGAAAAAPKGPPAAGRKRSKTNWSAMSLIAGGSATSLAPGTGASEPAGSAGAAAPGPAAGAAASPSGKGGFSGSISSRGGAGATIGASPSGGMIRSASAPRPAANTQPATEKERPPTQPAWTPISRGGSSPSSAATPGPSPNKLPPGQRQLQQGLQQLGEAAQQLQIPRLAENLVTSLVAQSLDLPPRAARWRHQQRMGSDALHNKQDAYKLPQAGSQADEDAGWESESEEGGAGASTGQPQDVRTRVAGMLEKERDFS